MNESKNNSLIIGMSKRLETCHICGSKRNIVQLKDMPKREQKIFRNAMKRPEFKNSHFVYCIQCSEFSMVSSEPFYFR